MYYAMGIVTLDLGPRTDLEIEERLRGDTGAERLTASRSIPPQIS